MMSHMPQIPPRPQRDRNNQTCSLGSELPKIPPRPTDMRSDRSISPHPVSFSPSPLNEIPPDQKKKHESSIRKGEFDEVSDAEIGRPPSVNLPSLGEEGIEYSDAYATEMEQQNNIFNNSQPVNIEHEDHASNTNKSELSVAENASIAPFTESSKAFEKEKPNDSSNYSDIRSKQNYPQTGPANQTTSSNSLNASNEHGIPQIGQIVPMYPNAGDVQAPSKLLVTNLATSTLSNDGGMQSKHHGRGLSGRSHDIPSDVYGRYGHGIISHDRFDKEYYKKHPELLKKEFRSYGEDRSEWALSSEDLNKIVRDTASRSSGNGGPSMDFGAPSEQIGFQATEEYASRISLSRPSLSRQITNLSTSESKDDSLIATDPSVNSTDPIVKENHNQLEQDIDTDENHMRSSNIIHVDDPIQGDTLTQGDHENDLCSDAAKKYPSSEKNEHLSYGAPILASDEVAKEPLRWELKPAVSPLKENAKTSQEESICPQVAVHQASLIQCKTINRPLSDEKLLNPSLPSLMPLEQLDEYEPLFPEEEKSVSSKNKSVDLAERLKFSEINRKFPSQDVWEDTPNSLQYTATVSTLQSPEDEKDQGKREEKTGPDTETLAHAFAKRQEELAEQEMNRHDKIIFQEKTKKKTAAIPKMEPVARPKLQNQRFPSRDIWEDTPASLLLQTTVAGPQIGKDSTNFGEEQQDSIALEKQANKTDVLSPSDGSNKNSIIPPELKQFPSDEPPKLRPSDSHEQPHPTKPEGPGKSAQVHVVGRSPSPSLAKSKPQVPARPSKSTSREPSDSLSPHNSPISISVKTKPPVPLRPIGSKIAALQGDFMSDLSKRLQLGPQASKKDVSKTEQQQENSISIPLVDARKSRARGPARHAPVKALIPKHSSDIDAEQLNPLKVSVTSTIWAFDPEKDYLQVLPCNPGQGNDSLLVEPTKM